MSGQNVVSFANATSTDMNDAHNSAQREFDRLHRGLDTIRQLLETGRIEDARQALLRLRDGEDVAIDKSA